MEVQVTPETAKKRKDLATTSGRAPEDIVEDALAEGEEVFRKLREKSERRRSGG